MFKKYFVLICLLHIISINVFSDTFEVSTIFEKNINDHNLGDNPDINQFKSTAINEALLQIVQEAVNEVIQADTKDYFKAKIKKQIFQKSKKYVFKYQTTNETIDQKKYTITINASINLDLLQLDLQKLGIPLLDQGFIDTILIHDNNLYLTSDLKKYFNIFQINPIQSQIKNDLNTTDLALQAQDYFQTHTNIETIFYTYLTKNAGEETLHLKVFHRKKKNAIYHLQLKQDDWENKNKLGLIDEFFRKFDYNKIRALLKKLIYNQQFTIKITNINNPQISDFFEKVVLSNKLFSGYTIASLSNHSISYQLEINKTANVLAFFSKENQFFNISVDEYGEQSITLSISKKNIFYNNYSKRFKNQEDIFERFQDDTDFNSVSWQPKLSEAENNNEYYLANPIKNHINYYGVLHSNIDKDYFYIKLPKNKAQIKELTVTILNLNRTKLVPHISFLTEDLVEFQNYRIVPSLVSHQFKLNLSKYDKKTILVKIYDKIGQSMKVGRQKQYRYIFHYSLSSI